MSEWCAFLGVITGSARIGILLLISLYYNRYEGTTAYFSRQYSFSMILEYHGKGHRTLTDCKKARTRLVPYTHF